MSRNMMMTKMKMKRMRMVNIQTQNQLISSLIPVSYSKHAQRRLIYMNRLLMEEPGDFIEF